MVEKSSLWMILVYLLHSWMILVYLLHDISAIPTFDFSSGFKPDKACGIEADSEFWSITGTLDLSKDMAHFSGTVVITSTVEICRINLTVCTSPPEPCKCTSNASNVYGLSIEQLAGEQFSRHIVNASYKNLIQFEPNQTIIGPLPFIYAPYKVTYEKDGIVQGELLTNHTVAAKSAVNLSICVENLVVEQNKSITLKLDVSEEQRTEVPACIFKEFKPQKTFNFTFIETAGCKRKKTFTINLVQDLPSGTESKDGVSTGLIVFGILAAGLVAFGIGFYTVRQSRGGQQDNPEQRQEEPGSPAEIIPNEQVESLTSSVHNQPSVQGSDAPATSWFSKLPVSATAKVPNPVLAAGPTSTGGTSSSKGTTQSSS